jgi:hypothetical protein
VEVPVEACDVVGFLEWGAFGGVWRAGDPCADRDVAGVDARAGQCVVEGESVTEEAPVVYSSVPAPAASMAGSTARVAVIAP